MAQVDLYGLRIGAALDVAECSRVSMKPMPGFTPPYAAVRSTCIKPGVDRAAGLVAFPPSAPPQHAVGGHIGYRLIDGSLAVLHFTTAGVPVQDQVLRDLKAKFGPADAQSSASATTVAGAVVDVVRATWTRADLRVEFMGATGHADTGEVVVGTPAGVAAFRDAQRAAVGNQRPL